MDTVRIHVPMTPELIRDLDEFRWQQRIASRAEAIRTLVIKGLRDLGTTPVETMGGTTRIRMPPKARRK